jgi:hypothetical protein
MLITWSGCTYVYAGLERVILNATVDTLYRFLFRYSAKELRCVTSLRILFVPYRLCNNIRLLCDVGDEGSVIVLL